MLKIVVKQKNVRTFVDALYLYQGNKYLLFAGSLAAGISGQEAAKERMCADHIGIFIDFVLEIFRLHIITLLSHV